MLHEHYVHGEIAGPAVKNACGKLYSNCLHEHVLRNQPSLNSLELDVKAEDRFRRYVQL